MSTSPLTLDDPVFANFAFYCWVVLVKTLLMTFITGYYRTTRQVFSNPEDCKLGRSKDLKPIFGHEDVERVRRCHLNDLENVIPFVLIGLLYVCTGPSLGTALLHFRIFAASRILHTLVYLGKVPQPARGLCFVVGMVVNVSLLVQIFCKVGM